jgi:CheY-like chemotaxis protein
VRQFLDGVSASRAVQGFTSSESGWPAEILPAIALTAFAREDDRRRALQAGYQAHFTKPLDVQGFLAEARRLVDQAAEKRRLT